MYIKTYDFAPDLDLSKEVEGSIFGVKGIEVSDGIVYAVVSCIEIRDYSCERCIFYDCYKDACSLSHSNSCIDGGCHRGGVGGALG